MLSKIFTKTVTELVAIAVAGISLGFGVEHKSGLLIVTGLLCVAYAALI